VNKQDAVHINAVHINAVHINAVHINAVHITVIAKTPVPGRVKTRLCPPCTFDQAAELATAALADTFDAIDEALDQWMAGQPPAVAQFVRRVILLDGEPAEWFPAHYDVVPQSDGDLNDRLTAGFAALGVGIIVAMDSPHSAVHAPRALDALLSGSDVIGFTDDGGYWGIGLAAINADDSVDSIKGVFAGISMSTDTTGAEQLKRLNDLGRAVEVLPPGQDIDDFNDVRALANTTSIGRTATVARRLVREIDAAG
jgi:uncharacterized protein